MGVAAAAGFPQQSGVLIPEIWSGKLLTKFYAVCLMAGLCNTDYEGEIKNKGDKVIIRTTPDIEIYDYTKGQTLNIQRPTPATLEMEIARAKYWNVHIDRIDQFQSDFDYLEDWTRDAAQQLKIAWEREFLADIYADAHASNKGSAAGAISGNIGLGVVGGASLVVGNGSGEVTPIQFLLSCSQVLDEQNVPEEERKIVVPAWLTARLKNSEIKDASLSGDDRSTLRNGRVGMVDRLEVFSSNLLPTEIVSSNKQWIGTASQKSAISFAAQLTENQILEKLESTFGSAARGLAVADWKVLKPEALVTYCIRPGTL